MSRRLGVPIVRPVGLVIGAVAVAMALDAALHWTDLPGGAGALLMAAAGLAACTSVWSVLLAGRIVVRGDVVRIFGVYRARSFPLVDVSALEVIEGAWPGRGAPVVLLGIHLPADYLRVRLRDGSSYEPPALCTLRRRRDESDALPTVADDVNRLIGAQPLPHTG